MSVRDVLVRHSGAVRTRRDDDDAMLLATRIVEHACNADQTRVGAATVVYVTTDSATTTLQLGACARRAAVAITADNAHVAFGCVRMETHSVDATVVLRRYVHMRQTPPSADERTELLSDILSHCANDVTFLEAYVIGAQSVGALYEAMASASARVRNLCRITTLAPLRDAGAVVVVTRRRRRPKIVVQ